MKFLMPMILLGTCLIAGAEPVRGRIDIFGDQQNAIVLTTGDITSGGIIGNASWGKTDDRKFYLTAETPLLSPNEWTKFSFSFTPEADGNISVILKSSYAQTKGKKQQDQVWVYWDNLLVEGVVSSGAKPVVLPVAGDVPPTAKAINGFIDGSFENSDGKGWFKNAGTVIVKDKAIAQDGQACVKVWCTANIGQNLKVKKGAKVTITGFAKPAEFVPAQE